MAIKFKPRLWLPVVLTFSIVLALTAVLSGVLYQVAKSEWQEEAKSQVDGISRIFAYWIDLEVASINSVAAAFYAFSGVNQSQLEELTRYSGIISQNYDSRSVGTVDENGEGDMEVLFVSQDSPWVYKGMKLSQHPEALLTVDNLLIETDDFTIGPIVVRENGEAVSYVASLAPSDQLGGLLLTILPLSEMLDGLSQVYFTDGLALRLSASNEISLQQPRAVTVAKGEQGRLAFEYQQRIFHSDVDWVLDWRVHSNYQGGINRSAANITLYAGIALALLLSVIVYVLRSQTAKIKLTVERQTKELKEKNESLVKAQEELVHAEKMASLGNLVAGVAHELNTPLGISYTGVSLLRENLKGLTEKFNQNKLSKKILETSLQGLDESSRLIENNVARSVELIGNFKMVAVDQSSDRRRQFKLAQTISEISGTLNHKLSRQQVELQVNVPETIMLDSFPGAIVQVMSNLILNSLIHGYDGQAGKPISIDAKLEGDEVKIVYKDHGKGIARENLDKVFNPFYTTKLGQGGSGLGLNIVYNLVHSSLGGKIKLESDRGQGVIFRLNIPVQAPEHDDTSDQ